VLSRPTTEQILLDCCNELMTGVLPALTDETAIVRVVMVETVMRNMAVRAAHEIAWMREETAAMDDYVRAVADRLQADLPDPGAAHGPHDSLHLDDVADAYIRAGRAFSAALEAAVASRDAELIKRGEALLDHRADIETEVMAGWSPTGR